MGTKNFIQQFNLYLMKGEFRKAKLILEKNFKNLENPLEINLNFGALYDQWALKIKDEKRKKEYQRKAKLYFKKALQNKETRHRAIRGLAIVSMHQKKYKEALQLYRRAFRIKRDIHTYNDLGNIYRKLKKYKISIRYYKKAYLLSLKKNKEFQIGPVFNLMMLNRELNNKREEKKYFKKLKELTKHSFAAKILLEKSKN